MSFEYELPTPPFSVPPFREMTLEEARRHFEWFTGIAEKRREILFSAMLATGDSNSACNTTPGSLVPVWAWVSRRLQAASETTLTPGSLGLVLDTSFFLAEVFFRQYPGRLRWALWDRKSGPYNKAVIEGFKVPLVPSDVVRACAWDVLHSGLQDDLLHRKYLVWAQDLERTQ